jgi:hypothetical protein
MIATGRRARVVVAFAAAAVLGVGMASTALAAAGGQTGSPGNSASQITGSFSSDCTDFSSTSSKDFSHIDFVFADGGTETVSQFSDTHSYTRTGDRVISTATVKAGTTVNRYPCTPEAPKPACSDGGDNDNDGLIDGAYPGCADENDNDETDPAPKPACSDGGDNDNDTKVDFPADPGCTDANDNDETDTPKAACADGSDNDGDGLIDFPADPGCSSADDNDEFNAPKAACDDGLDNDNDGKIDGADPGCTSPDDNDETDPTSLNRCEHDGLLGLLTEADEPTVAKAAYDAILNNIPILADPHGDGPISTPVGEGLAPLDDATGLPVGLEARCAISLVDGNGAPVPTP